MPCPHCTSLLKIPGTTGLERLQLKTDQFEWVVRRRRSDTDIQLSGLQELSEAINTGRVAGKDLCMVHRLAPPEVLKEACDRHYDIRRLYDPIGAYSARAFGVSVFTLGVLYALSSIVWAIVQGWGLFLLFGLLGIILTPTIVGLIIVYFIAAFCGVPLLPAYFGVLLGLILLALVSVIVGLLGGGIVYVLVWLMLKVLGVGKKPMVVCSRGSQGARRKVLRCLVVD